MCERAFCAMFSRRGGGTHPMAFCQIEWVESDEDVVTRLPAGILTFPAVAGMATDERS